MNRKTTPASSETRSEAVRSAVIVALRSTGNVLDATVESVTVAVARVIEETGRAGQAANDAVSDAAGGAVAAARLAGADLGQVTRGIMIGVIRAMKGGHGGRAGDDGALDTIRLASRVALREAARSGGDLEAAARGAVEGAIDGAKELGIRIEVAAATAAAGAMKGASREGEEAEESVRRVIRRPIKGLRILVEETPLEPPPPVKPANRMLRRGP